MVGVTKLRIKFGGPEGSVKTSQTFPNLSNCSNAKRFEKSIVYNAKKRGPKELEEVQAKKKQKLDGDLSTQCSTLLRLLRDHQLGWIFSEPVDPIRLKIPDYFSVISKPMDLGTIYSKLLKNAYSDADEFAADVRLTFTNAMLYNPPQNPVHKAAKELKEIFEVRWESLKKKKISELSRIEATKGSKRQPFKVDCSRQISPETSTSSGGRFSVELPKPAKEKFEKVSLLPKKGKGENKKDTPVVTPKALATKLRIKKPEEDIGASLTVKTPSKDCKCGSCGRITCICLKRCNSSESELSSLMDCQVEDPHSGSQARESDPQSNGENEGSVNSRNEKNGCVSYERDKPSNSALLDNELKTTLPAMPPLPPEKALRAAMLKCQFADIILRAKHGKVFDQSNKADLIKIQIEKEQQIAEKGRIEAEIRAAKIASRKRAETELQLRRDRERFELEKVKYTSRLEENNFRKLEKDFVDLCGGFILTRTQVLEMVGLSLRHDDCTEKIVSNISEAVRVDDLEEGEIL